METSDSFQIVSLRGAAHPDGIEYHGDVKWSPMDEDEFLAANSPKAVLNEPATSGGDRSGYDQAAHLNLAHQFLDAAKQQPGVAFGFTAERPGRPLALIKWEDGKLWIGSGIDPESFASVDGNDGDNDEDDLAVYPTGGTKEESKDVRGLVNRILREDIAESEADEIAMKLLGGF